MRITLLAFVVAVLGTGGCMPPAQQRVSMDPSSSRTVFRLGGEVRFDRAQGMVVLQLEPGSCTIEHPDSRFDACRPFPQYGWKSARLIPPWGGSIEPVQGGPNGLAFRLDWRHVDLDPLGAKASERLMVPWRIEAPDAVEPRVWVPREEDATAMLELIGEATDTQLGVSEVSSAPRLEVSSFVVDGDLRNGMRAELVLTVKNLGSGTAYRVTATTRCNLPALHGLQFSFGRLAPGEAKTRRLAVTLPRVSNEDEALVVLIFDEAHQFAPAPYTARFAVHGAVDVPQLSMTCRFEGVSGRERRVDAGQTVLVQCEVRNEGAPASGVRVKAVVTGGTRPVTSAAFDLGIGRATTVSLALEVPREAGIDSELTVDLEAAGGPDGVSTRTQLVLVVARPKMCPEGKFSREVWAKKRDELRRKLDAGLITRAEYDKYNAELVACLE